MVRSLATGVARRLRIQFPGAIYHIINRGNYRRDLFATTGAAKSFEMDHPNIAKVFDGGATARPTRAAGVWGRAEGSAGTILFYLVTGNLDNVATPQRF